jgi:hypothetical protein
MIDGLGTLRHLPGPGGMDEQAARDMEIYRVIRKRWIERTDKRNGV